MAPRPMSPEKIRTPREVVREPGARIYPALPPGYRDERRPRVFRRFVNRGGQLVEVGRVHRETR
jgi:hypothetical protein